MHRDGRCKCQEQHIRVYSVLSRLSKQGRYDSILKYRWDHSRITNSIAYASSCTASTLGQQLMAFYGSVEVAGLLSTNGMD